jgi:hypothetical protein
MQNKRHNFMRCCWYNAEAPTEAETLMMEALSTSETLVYFYETIRHIIQEGCCFHTHSHEREREISLYL